MMKDKALAAALAMAYHGKGRVKVVQDNISPLYFTDDEYSSRMIAVKNSLPGNLPPWRAGESVIKIMNSTVAGATLALEAFAGRSLKTAVLLGAKQYIMLNAGYNSFAHRQPEWAASLQLFEINPLDIAMDKQARLTRAGITAADNINYIYADVCRPDWEKLLTSHPVFVENKISFVNLGDVACYMDKGRFKTLLEQTGAFMTSGSSMVYAYNTADYEQAAENDFPFGEMEKLVSDCSLLIYEQLNGQDAESHFFTQYNYANIRTPLKTPPGVSYILAVKK